MLRKLINAERPDYIAAIFDTDVPTFRHDTFADYKATREAMPEDLSAQIPYIIRVCEAFNLPIIKYDRFEADDMIGTLAKKIAIKKMQAVIVSNDKDLCQLVSDPHVIAMRQNSTNVKRKVPVPPIEWCDEAWVVKKFGLPPSKIVDLLGLMGDSIDNIPGAPGIAKRSVEIDLEFGSAEEAMANAEKVTHKTYRESLQNNQAIIRQSLELATVHCEVPVELDLDQLQFREPNRTAAYELFRELEFAALTKEFADSAPLFEPVKMEDGSFTEAIEQKYTIVKDRVELDKLIRAIWEKEKFAFDVDDSNEGKWHSSFDKVAPLGISIAYAPGVSAFVDLENFDGGRDAAIRPLADLFDNPYLDKYTHDYKRKLSVLAKLDIKPRAVTDDVMIASYLLDSSRMHHEIEVLAQHNLDAYPADVTEEFPKNGWKSATRADWILQLAPQFRKKITADGLTKVYDEIELPLEPIIADIEMAEEFDAYALRTFPGLFGELATLKAKIFAISGREFNIGSPKQVGEIFEELNIATGRKTATGQVSTSKDVLAELAVDYEIAQFIIDYRELDKLRATYADALPKMINTDGRIHGVLSQTVAVTGRLSSTEPNLQNIRFARTRQRIRKAFIPEKGNKLISADYSQLELRISRT